jgi:hypothetical protein
MSLAQALDERRDVLNGESDLNGGREAVRPDRGEIDDPVGLRDVDASLFEAGRVTPILDDFGKGELESLHVETPSCSFDLL